MRKIILTRGYVALVDDEDYEALATFKWYATPARGAFGNCYAVRAIHTPVRKTLRMHCVILQPPPGFEVDHINGNGLDNRRSNLRLATRSQNIAGARKRKPGNSGYRGVRRYERQHGTIWMAMIGVNNAYHYIGTFSDPISAARAYDDAARQHFGEFARLNFPDGSTLPGKDAVREGHASIQGGPR